jgi:diguanylate cyclase (GGDEF)-like protein
MKQIGEFARENNITIRALHHYEKLGLISPTKIDEFTGYRYYDETQSNIIGTITLLKSLGFSLSEIKSLLEGGIDIPTFKKYLYEKKHQAIIDMDSTSTRLTRIVGILKVLEKSDDKSFSIKEIINMKNEGNPFNLTGHELFGYESRRMYEKSIEENIPLCTMTLDIDHFKRVNDDYGHDVGDVVIARIMNTITSSLININNNDEERCYSMLERAGGDEFKIIIRDTLDVCKTLAQDILNNVKNIDFNDVVKDLHVTVSIGIASIENKPMSCSHLFHLSESALYEAKVKARGIYQVYI